MRDGGAGEGEAVSEYRILKTHSTESLQNEVNILRLSEPEWRTVGGPFLEPYASGHGPCLAVNRYVSGEPVPDTIFVNFCQAMEKP